MIDLGEVYNGYKNRVQKNKQPVSGRIGASAIGKCQKQAFFKLHGIPISEMIGRTKAVFSEGNMHEDEIVTTLRLAGIDLEDVGKMGWFDAEFEGITIKGQVDGRIKDFEDGKDAILEIKSTGPDVRVRRLQKPYPDHRRQIELYMRHFELEYGVVLYKARESGYANSFVVTPSTRIWNGMLAWLKELAEAKEVEELPVDLGACPWCAWHTECWGHAYKPIAEQIDRGSFAR